MLTKKQKKLPMALQKAILKKQKQTKKRKRGNNALSYRKRFSWRNEEEK